jgi:hypothetical protein
MVVGYAFFGIILGAILGAILGGLGGLLAEFAAPVSSRSPRYWDPPPVWIGLGRSGDGYCA